MSNVDIQISHYALFIPEHDEGEDSEHDDRYIIIRDKKSAIRVMSCLTEQWSISLQDFVDALVDELRNVDRK